MLSRVESQMIIIAFLLVTASTRQSIGQPVERNWNNPGDGLLTYDSNTGLEWLDFTETTSMSLADITAQIAPGGSLAGFAIASRDETRTFMSSFGITTNSSSPANGQPVATAIGLLGETDTDRAYAFTGTVATTPGNYYYVALTSYPTLTPIWGAHRDTLTNTPPNSFIGWALHRTASGGSGSATVPEPMSLAAWLTVGLASGAFCGWCRRRTRRNRPQPT